jgi:hypothetical protein
MCVLQAHSLSNLAGAGLMWMMLGKHLSKNHMFPSEIHVNSCVCEPEKCFVGLSTSGLVVDIIISTLFRPLVQEFTPNSSRQKKQARASDGNTHIYIYMQTILIHITTHGDIRLQTL